MTSQREMMQDRLARIMPYASNPEAQKEIRELQTGISNNTLGANQMVFVDALNTFQSTNNPSRLVQVLSAKGLDVRFSPSGCSQLRRAIIQSMVQLQL